MDKSLLEQMYYNLPKTFRNADAEQQQQLKRYLDILVAGGFNPLHEETKALLTLLEFETIPREYLAHLASDIGFRFPHDVDEPIQRTYIKNAVLSYRMKGTKKALLFMLRELTRFHVTVHIDEDTKSLAVIIEVTDDRQDMQFLREKAQIIIDEYSPPYRQLTLQNVFVWFETFNNRRLMRDEVGDTYLFFYSSHDEDKTLYFNNRQWATLNSTDYNLSNFQQYNRNNITYSDAFRIYSIHDIPRQYDHHFEDANLNFEAERRLEKLLLNMAHNANPLFILTEPSSTTQEENNQISGTVERWDREKYAILGKGEQTEFSNQETYDSMESQDDHTDIIIRNND